MAIPGWTALEQLKDGNRRFQAGTSQPTPALSLSERVRMAAGQQPFAAVLGCSDSRVPVETIFDCGPGDLFVVRVAGNIAAPTQIASLAFAVEKFETRLVVVLGHTYCGAVQATLEALEAGVAGDGGPLIGRIRPAVEGLEGSGPDLVRRAVRANVAASVETLRGVIEGEGLLVVGAEYDLETGEVAVLDAG
jgi:carbonic anhydrase